MNKRAWLPVFMTLLVGLSALLLGARPADAAVPAGFEDRLVTSVDGATALDFTPDGRLLVTDRSGRLRVYKDGSLLSTPALDISGKVCSNGERGMLGLAVDPSFATNHYVYIYYTYNKFNVCPTKDPGNPKNPVNRVSRFTMSGDTIDPASENVLIDNILSPNGNHNGGDLHFGKDNYLYASVGDGGCDYASPSNCQYNNDASRDTNILLGKVLRITRDGGIPPDNPYQGANSGRCNVNGRTTAGDFCQETFARGFRNPFRMAFDPDAAGTSFRVDDVGGAQWEEIDTGKNGADYGWNLCEGTHDNPYRAGSVNCSAAPYTPPIHEYSHSTGCSSVTGGAFIPNGAWPASYDTSYLFADYVCGKIFKLTPKSGGGFTKTEFATGLGQGGPVSMTFAPYQSGKSLYYTTYAGGGQVRRITYTAGNRAPNAVLKADPTFSVNVPMDVSFDGSGSSDPDSGDTLTYDLDFGDGSAHATSATANHTYTTAGTYNATLTVTDGVGVSDTATVRIDAGNTPPTPQIESPTSGTRFEVRQKFTLQGSAVDAEDGQLADSALSWEVLQHHNGTHTHPYLSGSGNDLSLIAPPPEDLLSTNPKGNYLEIRLTATDSKGRESTVTRNLYPKAVNVKFATRPTDLQLVVGGAKFRAPRTFLSWEGYNLNVYAPDQRHDGHKWVFKSWSDGRAARHTITTPASGKTYEARFERR
jgi:glucose/arabinose dehydrogenase